MKYHEQRNVAPVGKKPKGRPRKYKKPEEEQEKAEPPGDAPFVSATFIDAENLVPKKVLNIFHVKDNEKSLVAEILFEKGEESFDACVFIEWAKNNCPQLVIKYYESRIQWLSKA